MEIKDVDTLVSTRETSKLKPLPLWTAQVEGCVLYIFSVAVFAVSFVAAIYNVIFHPIRYATVTFELGWILALTLLGMWLPFVVGFLALRFTRGAALWFWCAVAGGLLYLGNVKVLPAAHAFAAEAAREVDLPRFFSSVGRATDALRELEDTPQPTTEVFESAACPYQVGFPKVPVAVGPMATISLRSGENFMVMCDRERHSDDAALLERATRVSGTKYDPEVKFSVHDGYIIASKTREGQNDRGQKFTTHSAYYFSRTVTQTLSVTSLGHGGTPSPEATAFLDQAKVFGSPFTSKAFLAGGPPRIP